jgi:hypothetical protein
MIVSNEDISNEFVPHKGLKHKYLDGAPEEGAGCYSLQPAHTHFVFFRADKATLANSGNTPAEQLRNARIRAYKAGHAVEKEMAAASTGRFMPARVLAIFGGDEFTLGEIESYVAGKHGRVLLLSSTGGLAQALGQFIKKGEIVHEDMRTVVNWDCLVQQTLFFLCLAINTNIIRHIVRSTIF